MKTEYFVVEAYLDRFNAMVHRGLITADEHQFAVKQLDRLESRGIDHYRPTGPDDLYEDDPEDDYVYPFTDPCQDYLEWAAAQSELDSVEKLHVEGTLTNDEFNAIRLLIAEMSLPEEVRECIPTPEMSVPDRQRLYAKVNQLKILGAMAQSADELWALHVLEKNEREKRRFDSRVSPLLPQRFLNTPRACSTLFALTESGDLKAIGKLLDEYFDRFHFFSTSDGSDRCFMGYESSVAGWDACWRDLWTLWCEALRLLLMLSPDDRRIDDYAGTMRCVKALLIDIISHKTGVNPPVPDRSIHYVYINHAGRSWTLDFDDTDSREHYEKRISECVKTIESEQFLSWAEELAIGDDDLRRALVRAYASGQGELVPQDVSRAFFWMNQVQASCDEVNFPLESLLGLAHLCQTDEQYRTLSKFAVRGLELLPAHPGLQAILYRTYASGLGGTPDAELATQWLNSISSPLLRELLTQTEHHRPLPVRTGTNSTAFVYPAREIFANGGRVPLFGDEGVELVLYPFGPRLGECFRELTVFLEGQHSSKHESLAEVVQHIGDQMRGQLLFGRHRYEHGDVKYRIRSAVPELTAREFKDVLPDELYQVQVDRRRVPPIKVLEERPLLFTEFAAIGAALCEYAGITAYVVRAPTFIFDKQNMHQPERLTEHVSVFLVDACQRIIGTAEYEISELEYQEITDGDFYCDAKKPVALEDFLRGTPFVASNDRHIYIFIGGDPIGLTAKDFSTHKLLGADKLSIRQTVVKRLWDYYKDDLKAIGQEQPVQITIRFPMTKSDDGMPSVSDFNEEERTDFRKTMTFDVSWCPEEDDVQITDIEILYDGITHIEHTLYGYWFEDGSQHLKGYPAPIVRFTLNRYMDPEEFREAVGNSSYYLETDSMDDEQPPKKPDSPCRRLCRGFLAQDWNGYTSVVENVEHVIDNLKEDGVFCGKRFSFPSGMPQGGHGIPATDFALVPKNRSTFSTLE